MRALLIACTFASIPLLAGCPKPRTAAMTQPTPAAFDAAASDKKALEVADAGLVALGGYDKWSGLKELRFEEKISHDGQLKLWTIDQWDRWNGRHNAKRVSIASLASGKPDDVKISEVRYDLFDTGKKPYAIFDGKPLPHQDAMTAVGDARKHLAQDAYLLTLIYRVRDPGVHLATGGETKIEGTCNPSCQNIKITFDAGVGKDTYFINYNTTTKLPEVIEQQTPQGKIGYQILGWADAGGLKWPTKLQNIGMKGEIIEFSSIAVGTPDDNDYMHNVNE